MPMIDEAIVFDANFETLIAQTVNSPGFTHTIWGEDVLQPLRIAIRAFYRDKQKGECAYCKFPISLHAVGNSHVEHIAPKSLHLEFIFHPKNLCVICADCNTIKRAQEVISEIPETLVNTGAHQYPLRSNSFKIVHPHFDQWEDHILKFGKAYVDKSAKGQFTIAACKLNRFFHAFEWSEEYVSDIALNSLMTEFLDSSNTFRRSQILNELRDILLPL